MRLFPLMFSRVGRRFRSLVKMGPALQILYPSQSSEKKKILLVEAKWRWRSKEPTKELQTWWTTSRFPLHFGKCKHREMVNGGQSDRPGCSSTSSLYPYTFSESQLTWTLSSSATPWVSPSDTWSHLCAKQIDLNTYPTTPRKSSAGHF